MTDNASGQRHRKRMEMPGLLIPADPEKPVQVIELMENGQTLRPLQQAVGGLVDVRETELGDLWMNDEGRMNGSALNARVTRWTLNDSREAKAGQLQGYEEYWLTFGDVVVTGPPDHNGDITPVKQEAIDTFSAMEIHPQAMADWNEPTIPPVIVTEWDLGEPDGGIDL